MAAITVQTAALTGTAITTTAAGVAGDTFVNNGKTLYKVVNGAGAPITVTFTATGGLPGGASVASVALVSVTNGTTKYFGPFPQQYFNNASGAVAVTYSDVTTITVAAISLP